MKNIIIKIKKKLHFNKLIAKYAIKILLRPIGTTYEINREPVNRFYYTYHVTKALRRFT